MLLRAFASRASRVALHACVLAGAIGAFAASAADNFKVRLTPVPIEAATAAATTGSGAATAALDGTRLTLRGNFSGLKGAATTAALHRGSVRGVRGPAIVEVAVPQVTSGDFTTTVTLTPDQAEGVRQGQVYLQIHSTSAPEGNLWGWLLP
jgi:hypothetical protein